MRKYQGSFEKGREEALTKFLGLNCLEPPCTSYSKKNNNSWEPEGRYCISEMFRWEPEGCYRCTKSMAIAPFWFSIEHLWIAIVPLWLSTDDMGLKLALNDIKVNTFTIISLLILFHLAAKKASTFWVTIQDTHHFAVFSEDWQWAQSVLHGNTVATTGRLKPQPFFYQISYERSYENQLWISLTK